MHFLFSLHPVPVIGSGSTTERARLSGRARRGRQAERGGGAGEARRAGLTMLACQRRSHASWWPQPQQAPIGGHKPLPSTDAGAHPATAGNRQGPPGNAGVHPLTSKTNMQGLMSLCLPQEAKPRRQYCSAAGHLQEYAEANTSPQTARNASEFDQGFTCHLSSQTVLNADCAECRPC